jgi:hypothetical protein
MAVTLTGTSACGEHLPPVVLALISSLAEVPVPGQPLPGGREPCPADDRRGRQPAATKQEQVDQGVLAGVVG